MLYVINIDIGLNKIQGEMFLLISTHVMGLKEMTIIFWKFETYIDIGLILFKAIDMSLFVGGCDKSCRGSHLCIKFSMIFHVYIPCKLANIPLNSYFCCNILVMHREELLSYRCASWVKLFDIVVVHHWIKLMVFIIWVKLVYVKPLNVKTFTLLTHWPICCVP